MLLLQDLPDEQILQKFADRYPAANTEQVMQFLSLLRISADLALMLDRFLGKHDLLQGRWWVLILLMREDDYRASPSDLAAKAGVSRATMTGLIDGLIREKLVTRERDEVDRRQVMIELTDAGQAKLDSVMPDYYQRVNALMDGLGDDAGRLLELMTVLHKQRHVFD